MKFFLVVSLFNCFVLAENLAKVDFKVSGGISFSAKTSDIKGKVILQNNEVTAQGIVVNLKNLSTGMSLRDDHMKNKYLEVPKYPEAFLVMGKGKDGKGKGKVKIKGIEKDIEGTYKILDNKELEAKFDLKLEDFNIKGIRYMNIGVKDLVSLTVVVPLEKK